MDKKLAVISALVEGNSIRATSRMTGVNKRTITRLLLSVGAGCERLLDQRMRQLPCRFIQYDEIWTFVKKKDKRVNGDDNVVLVGDQYVFVALDAETKLVPCFRVGKRSAENTWYFVRDLQERLRYRVQLTTDGYRAYLTAVEDAFGADIDYAMLVKTYEHDESKRERYSPSDIVQAVPTPLTGFPDPKHISTSYVERQNLTMRMQLRRFTRLTNAFSKKLTNLRAAVALHFAHYNFVRIHQSLRVTPAMAAGVTDCLWSLDNLLGELNGKARGF
jgi:IS1 family transposase